LNNSGTKKGKPMEKTLTVLNKMIEERVIEKFAIGGGIAALFYIPSPCSFHLEIIVQVKNENGAPRIGPLYDYLNEKGYQFRHGFFIIEGVPVKFLFPNDRLICEALENSNRKTFKNRGVNVLRLEFLIAIRLNTKAKYFSNILDDIPGNLIDKTFMNEIFSQHDLFNLWDQEMEGVSHCFRRVYENKLFGRTRATWKFKQELAKGFSETMYLCKEDHSGIKIDESIEERIERMIDMQRCAVEINIEGSKQFPRKHLYEDLQDILPWRINNFKKKKKKIGINSKTA
jgi:hypothetical protein